MNIINVPKHAISLTDDLSSILFDENIPGLSEMQLFGIALAAGYATKNTLITNDLDKYARGQFFLSTMSLSKYAASMAELNANCEEQNSFIIGRKSAASILSSFGDSRRYSVPSRSYEAPSANVGNSSAGSISIENVQSSSQDRKWNQESEFNTDIFVLAATYVINREFCLKIGTELISDEKINKYILMTIVRIAALVDSISAQIKLVDEPPYRVLLIDDDARITRRLKLSLERKTNFVVKTENNSFKVLQVAREFSPDIIVLDLYMPGKNGGEVLESLQADPELRDIKVVFLTSLLTKEEAGEHGKFISGNLYMAKPTEDRIIIDTIRDQLAIPDLLAA